MKNFAILICVALALAPFAEAQGQTQNGNSRKISPAKAADIRRLFELSGGKNVVGQLMDGMSKSIKPLVVSSLPPGAYREKLVDLFFEKFRSKADVGSMVELLVPIYDKYFSHEEVKGLIQFYGTPLGQKAVSVLPQLTAEMQQQAGAWGQQLGRDAMTQVLDEHPDLKAALEQAAKQAHPK
jgi:hypothetical protein